MKYFFSNLFWDWDSWLIPNPFYCFIYCSSVWVRRFTLTKSFLGSVFSLSVACYLKALRSILTKTGNFLKTPVFFVISSTNLT